MTIHLLTHQRELQRETNTGRLVLESLKEKAIKIVWDRTAPDDQLLKMIEAGSVALLYPSEESKPISETNQYENYILIDSTWQEAQKIYNRSPYLHKLAHVKIQATQPSQYQLRRNQKSEGLCTAEVVIEMLTYRQEKQLADTLQLKFIAFLEASTV